MNLLQKKAKPPIYLRAERLMEKSKVLTPDQFDFAITPDTPISPGLVAALDLIEAAEFDTSNAYDTVTTFTGERRTRAGLWLAHELGHGECMAAIRRQVGRKELVQVRRDPGSKVKVVGCAVEKKNKLSKRGRLVTKLAVGVEGLVNEVTNGEVQKKVEAEFIALGLTEEARFMRLAFGQESLHAMGYAEDIEEACAVLTRPEQWLALWMITRDGDPVGVHSEEDKHMVGQVVDGLFDEDILVDDIREGVMKLAPNREFMERKIQKLESGIIACQQAFRDPNFLDMIAAKA